MICKLQEAPLAHPPFSSSLSMYFEHAGVGTHEHHEAKEHSVHDSTATLAEMKALVEDFVARRGWKPFHDAKNLSCSIAIEAAELMEHFQWLRSDQIAEVCKDPNKMQQIREELADITAYALSFASTMGIDLSSALEDKVKKNALKYPVEKYFGRFNV